MKRISANTIREMRDLRSQGFSLREVAAKLGVHFSTVSKHVLPQESSEALTKCAGRPLLLARRVRALLVRWFEAGLTLTTTDAINQLQKVHGIKASRQTIARILKCRGLKNYARPLKPRLLPKHKKDRRNFARIMRHAPESFWENVVFTDESKFNLHGPDGTKRGWRRPGSQLLEHHVRKVVEFGGAASWFGAPSRITGSGDLCLYTRK